jgi:hypothetical protein
MATGGNATAELAADMADLIGRASLSSHVTAHVIVERIAHDLDALDELLLDDEIRDLEERLVAARAKRTAVGQAEADLSASALVRRWAAEQGIEVNARGRIPSDVLAAYNAAVAI